MAEKVLGSLTKGIVFVISAPAGTGKTTLVRMLVDEFPCVTESISCTTRPMRPGEIAGKDYHFMKKGAFEKQLKEGAFLEHASVFGYQYGTLKAEIEEQQQKKNHIILVIDTQGALQLKESGYKAVYIFIKPPSLASLRERLFKRKTEEKGDIEKRLAWAEKEIKAAKHYDYIIINDNLHHAHDILRSVLIAEEHKQERYHARETYE